MEKRKTFRRWYLCFYENGLDFFSKKKNADSIMVSAFFRSLVAPQRSKAALLTGFLADNKCPVRIFWFGWRDILSRQTIHRRYQEYR